MPWGKFLRPGFVDCAAHAHRDRRSARFRRGENTKQTRADNGKFAFRPSFHRDLVVGSGRHRSSFLRTVAHLDTVYVSVGGMGRGSAVSSRPRDLGAQYRNCRPSGPSCAGPRQGSLPPPGRAVATESARTLRTAVATRERTMEAVEDHMPGRGSHWGE